MYEQSLIQAGLSQDQAEIYEIMVKNGSLQAGKITKKTTIKRGLVYKILDQLLEFGLIAKEELEGKPTIFSPAHPNKLKDLVEKRQQQAKDAQISLQGFLPQITSDFNLSIGMPGVQFFEGIEGIKKIYDDILNTGKDIYLVRAVYEQTYNEKVLPIVKDFIKKRVNKKIRAIALTPRDSFEKSSPQYPKPKDSDILFERTWVNKKSYDSPVEIDIYGDKIAILSFGKELIGMIIESPQIARAFSQIFSLAQLGAKNPS